MPRGTLNSQFSKSTPSKAATSTAIAPGLYQPTVSEVSWAWAKAPSRIVVTVEGISYL